MEPQTLVLAPWMAPHGIVSWEAAIVSVFTKKSEVIESYEATVSSPSMTIHIPAVTILRKAIVRVKKAPKFSRSSVYQRDSYSCQYCGREMEEKKLTYDHVIPRVQGGKTRFENIVTACRACNSRKGGRTPAQAGMRLLSKPIAPKSLMLNGILRLPREVPEIWLPYLEGHKTLRMVG